MPHPKVPQQISNPVSENIQKLASLFPSAVKDGELDIEALKQELGQFTEVGPERYELTWAGKQDAKQTAFEPVMGRTLKYIPEDSKNPDTTENLYIEGDNLEVLKLLRQNYYGAVKMIYIDPPYNRGGDFIYNDNFKMAKEEHEIAEGDRSELGERYTVNHKDSNRYHTNWLNMMYSRLKIAKDFLSEDGAIFISIDDYEVKNMRGVCDEIFGEKNFIASICWQKRYSRENRGSIGDAHEYILVFAKEKECFSNQSGRIPLSEQQSKVYRNSNDDPKGRWRGIPMTAQGYRPNQMYEVTTPSGQIMTPPEGRCWSTIESEYLKLKKEGRIYFGKNGDSQPQVIRYLSEVEGVVPWTWLPHEEGGHTDESKKEMYNFFGKGFAFETPKPLKLLKRLITICSKENDYIVLDFFSGSSTTAHAVMQLNTEDGGNRKHIMVQLPEPCPIVSKAFKFLDSIGKPNNICEIGKERIHRAGKKIIEENQDKDGIENLDIGFKVFRVGDTNINWLHQDLKGADMFDHYDKNASDKDKLDFTSGFTDLDVVYEIMLRQTDIPLSSSVEKRPDIGERTFIFADSFVVCLEQDITRDLVDKLAAIEPLPIKFIFRDSAFDDDISLKDETFRRLSALIERNSGGEKQTYTVEFI